MGGHGDVWACGYVCWGSVGMCGCEGVRDVGVCGYVWVGMGICEYVSMCGWVWGCGMCAGEV